MKNVFKKTLKFISSRLIYLVIGIFLAVGATYVYATWDAARTGGSGQLTEANWNELVNMVENKLDATISSVYDRVDNSYSACFSLLRGLPQGTSCDGYWMTCPSGWTRVATNWVPLYGYYLGNYQGESVLCNSVCCLPR